MMASSRSSAGLRRRGSSNVMLIGLLALIAVVIGGGVYLLRKSAKKEGDIILTDVVARGPFENLVLEQGEVESSRNVEVVCEVEARNSAGTAILWVVPEGAQVNEGDKLVELDASALQQEQKQQRIVVNTSLASKVTAQSLLDQANVAKTEYLDGIFTQEEKLIQSEILIAEEKLSRARETAKFSERLAALGFQSALQLKADQFAVEQASVELELAKSKLRTLQDITKKKMLIQLDADIETAKAQLEAATNSYEEETKKLAEVEEQIGKCVIYAPQGGVVVHANKTSSRGNAEFVVEAGAMVREQQVIIRLPDPTKMQVRANINEARVPSVKEGMPVAIRIGALQDTILQGVVTKVNKYAEPTSWFSSQVKEYGTFVQILNPPAGIRNGMTAEIRIFVERQSDELQVPVQALYEHKGRLFSLVKNGTSYETRQITIGSSNDKTVTIRDGLQEGETIVLNPRTHRGLLDLPDLPDPPRDLPPELLAGGSGLPADVLPTSDVSTGAAAAAGDDDAGSQAALSALLSTADQDGDGNLSSAEIATLPEYQQRLLKRGDVNSDGVVDANELAALAAEFEKPASEAAAGGGE